MPKWLLAEYNFYACHNWLGATRSTAVPSDPQYVGVLCYLGHTCEARNLSLNPRFCPLK